MRLLYGFMFALLPLLTGAQITILNADMPKVNDTLRYSTSTDAINYATTDTNYHWNFSGISIEHQDVQKYYAPASTPYMLQFFTLATYGIPEGNIGLGPLGGAAGNVFSFYKASNTALVAVGRGATIQNLPLGITYSQRDTLFKYPLQYGSSFTGNYAGEVSLPGLGTLKQTGTRNTVVDGWGTITTPFGTFDCIRVRSTVVGTDSIVFNGFGIPLPANRTEYSWLAKGERFPILEVVTNNLTSTITSARFKDRYRAEAYLSNCNFNASKTLGKPGDTITLTNTSYGKPKAFNWQITPATFNWVSGFGPTSEFPKVIFTATGDYDVKLSVTYEGGADDSLRTAYIKIREGSVPKFFASNNHPSVSEIITLLDSSTGSPNAWLWTITPSTGVVYVNGTSNISQNPKVQFNNIGSYAVQLRVTNASGSTTLKVDNFIQVWAIGITELSGNEMQIIPNPGKDFIQVKGIPNGLLDLEITDLMGRKVAAFPQYEAGASMNISGLIPGCYLLHVKSGNATTVTRFVKE